MAKKRIQSANVNLPENSLLNQQVVNELNELFTFSSPKEYRKSIDYIYSQFLIHINLDAPPIQFKKLAEDMLFLKTFLDKADDELNNPNF